MVRRVYLAEYRSLMKELRELYRAHGAELTIHYRPIKWSAIRSGRHARYGTYYGQYIPKQRRAIVTFRGAVPRWKKLLVIAHELRHAIHHDTDMFADYYSECPSDVNLAWKAEVDCDTYAIKFLNSHNLHPDEGDARAYTIHYLSQFRQLFKERREKFKSSLTSS